MTAGPPHLGVLVVHWGSLLLISANPLALRLGTLHGVIAPAGADAVVCGAPRLLPLLAGVAAPPLCPAP